MAVFGDRALPTGLQHGTMTVRTEGGHVEVTTYRTDGTYADHRHPDKVTFTRSLEEDLARRDFTVNAMALSAGGKVYDPMGGREDLAAGLLRCVGEPDRRFDEDALRILRGLRFASVLEFAIEDKTAEGIRRNRELLREIAAERILVELDKLLCGKAAAAVLREYPEVLGVFLPEILPSVGFEQHSRYHCYDVWEHTLRAVAAAAPRPELRLAMLLHDLGKPSCFTMDAQGSGHFYGHPAVSRDLAERILSRLKYDNDTRKTVLSLVEYHDRPIAPTERSVRRALRFWGEEGLGKLLQVKRADNLAQAEEYRCRQKEIDAVERIARELIARDACFSLKQLAVNGRDLTALGLAGAEIGAELDRLLTAVVDGELENDRETLLEAVKNRKNKF